MLVRLRAWRNRNQSRMNADTVTVALSVCLACVFCGVLGQQQQRVGPPGSQNSPGMSERLVPQVSRRKCSYDADCADSNSYCKGNDAAAGQQGLCACKEDRFIVLNDADYNCVAFADGWGSACIVDRQCEIALGIYGQCNSKSTCDCKTGSHFFKDECYKSVGIGDICRFDRECRLGDDSFQSVGSCVDGRCVCGYNAHQTATGNCVRTSQIGDDCMTDDNCIQDTAICRVKCVCRPGFVSSSDGKDCLKAAIHVGEACDQLSQCTELLSQAECAGGRCVCIDGAHSMGARCFRSRHLGDPCKLDGECRQLNANQLTVDCRDGECACRNGTQQRGQLCLDPNGRAADSRDSAGIAFTASSVVGVAVMMLVFCLNY